MSDEQQQAAIGRTVEEYGACNKKVAILQAEAIRVGASLASLARALSTSNQQTVYTIGEAVSVVNQEAHTLPTADDVRTLVQDLKTEMERKQELFVSLKNMGIEPKD